MKTRVLKILGIALITVALTVSFFAIPVSAADVYRVVLNFPTPEVNYFGFVRHESSFDSNSFSTYRPASATVDLSSGVRYVFGVPDVYAGKGYMSVVIGFSSFGNSDGQYFSSDVFWTDPFTFNYTFDQLANSKGTTSRWRLALRQMTNDGITYIAGTSDWVSELNGDQASIDVPKTRIPLDSNVNCSGLALCIDFQFDVSDPNGEFDSTQAVNFNVVDGQVVCNYANQNSPDLPLYDGPTDTGKVDELDVLDQEVLAGVQDGMDTWNDLSGDLGNSLATFRSGLHFVTNILNIPLQDNIVIRDFVQICLSLGISASLLGIAGSIIGAAARRRHGGD